MSVPESDDDIFKDGKVIGEYLRQTQYYTNIYGKNTILIMLVGSFYEIYALKSNENQEYYEGSTIEEVSHICDLVVKQKAHKYKNKFLYQSGFRDLYWDRYVERLTQNNFCVVKFDQDVKDKTNRKLSQIYSPGTFFQDNTFKLSNNTTCIWVEKFTSKQKPCYVFGLSTIDIYSGKTNIFELLETPIQNKILGDELERYLTIYNPSEIICVFRNLSENDEIGLMLEKMLAYHCSMITYITPNSAPELWKQILNCSKDTYIETSVNQFYNDEYVEIILDYMRESSVALQSFIYLLHWIVNHNPYLIENLQLPLLESHSKHVYLANNSLKQLNYNGSHTNRYQNDVGSNKYGSVIELLNQCITPMGKREFQLDLCHPIFDVNVLQEKYDIIEEIINVDGMIENIRKTLRNCFDVDKLKRSVIMHKVTPNMLHNLYISLETVIPIYDVIESSHSKLLIDKFIKFQDLTRSQQVNEYDVKNLCETFSQMFSKTYDLCQLSNNHSVPLDKNIFQKGYDSELDNIELKIEDNDLSIQHVIDSLQELLITGGYEKKNKRDLVKINYTEKSPPTLLCTKKRGENIIKAINELNVKGASKTNLINNSSLFHIKGDLINITITKYTASNVSINCDYINKLMKIQFTLQNKYKTLLNDTFNRAKLELKTYYDHIDIMCSFLSLIDINITKGFVIQKYNYTKPKIEKYQNTFENENKREKKSKGEKTSKVIKHHEIEDNNNDIKNITSYFVAKNMRHCLIEQFQNEDTYVANDICFDSRQQGVLLFGTNAVGKTCFMKAIGITIIMAQCGMYVPCSEFVYYPYKKLFTRILNQDNIFKGLSTFANEMTELRNILHNANQDSLVLGDELCSGTEHESALSIFVSGLSYLYSKNVQFLFATHLHEIVDYEEVNSMRRLQKYHLTVHYNREKDILVYDRKLKSGSGIPIYGLEVCQSLHLPNDFIKYAYDIRNKYHPSHVSVLDSQTSHFNTKKVVAYCELCKKEKAKEVHHMIHQKNANVKGFINNEGHKNHKSNLTSLCEKCHNKIHKDDVELKRKKTTNGYILEDVEQDVEQDLEEMEPEKFASMT